MPHRVPALVPRLSALCLLAWAILPGPTFGEDDPAAAARAVIKKLPAPTPVVTYDYEGDFMVGGLWSGETRYTAKVAKVGRQAVWRVTQDTYLDYAGAETRIRVLLHLESDLSILSGTYERKGKDGSVSLAFSRAPSGLLVQCRRAKPNAEPTSEIIQMKLDVRATASVGALLLFLRGVFADPETSREKRVYELPWISSLEFDKADPKAERKPMRITVGGAGTFGEGKSARKTRVIACRHGATQMDLHLTADGRGLVGIRRPGAAGDVVPRGEGGERLTVKPDQPAETWQQAFLKFGFGYHLPRRSLLEAAFHWDAMYEHETKVLKRWDAKRPLDEFKEAWIQEFVTQSKHRSIHDARRLLSMTLGTGKVKKKTKDAIVFAAHQQFGGGVQRTYYLRKKDGVWGITRIEF